jgi:hypothetical protein
MRLTLITAVTWATSVPPDRSCDQLKPPNPLRPGRAIGTRQMARVEENPFRSGERHAQHNPRRPPTSLPDSGADGLRVDRSILSTEPSRRRVKPKREEALLGLRLNVGTARVADRKCCAVDQVTVGMKLEHQGVAAGAGTEPMPDEGLLR